MWCVDNTIFLLGFIISISYAVILHKYNLKRRRIERVFMLLNFLFPIALLFYYYYPVFKLDFQYNHVYHFLFSNATSLDKFSSTIYSAPSLYVIIIISIITLYIRMKWRDFIGRASFRKVLYGNSMTTSSLYLVLTYTGLIKKYSRVVVEGSGPYPLQKNILLYSQIILGIAIVSLILISVTVFIGMWEKKISAIWKFGGVVLDVSMILTVILFFIRIYYNNIFLSRTNFIKWDILDIMIGGILVSCLFIKDSLILTRNRVLGVLPFSAYLTAIYTILFLFHISPKPLLGLENAIYVSQLTPALVIPGFFMALPVGSRILKRSFYPWMSEEKRYYIRAITSFIYIIILTTIIYLSITQSIYFSAGEYSPLNELYILTLQIFFLISLVISPIIQLIMKWVKNFYIFYGILFSLVALLVGSKIYGFYDFRILILIVIGIGITALIGLLGMRKIKGFSLYNVYILTFLIFLIIFFSANMYSEKGVASMITSEKSVDAYGLSIKYNSFKSINSSIQVMCENQSKEELNPLYRIMELDVIVGSKNVKLSRVVYPSKNIILSKGYLYSRYLYTIKLMVLEDKKSGVDIAVYRYNWFYYNYYIWPLILSIAILLYSKDEALDYE